TATATATATVAPTATATATATPTPTIPPFNVTTNSGSGLQPTYTTLALAIADLNAATITSPVIITLHVNETAPAGGYAITQSGGTSTNTIIIQSDNNTITASGAQVVGALNDSIFKLIGANWVTLRSFTMQENPANTITAE